MSKSLLIGTVELKNPFLLAPLAGITDKSMRSLCADAGASLTYTEMVSGKGLWYGDRKSGKLLETGDSEGQVAFQLFGSEPEIMEHAAKTLCSGIDDGSGPGRLMTELDEPVLIDLNAGCPVPKIVKNGEGSALLKNPQRLYDLVAAMVKGATEAAEIKGETPKPVTVKMRTGFRYGENTAVECAKAAEAAGAAAVTVHGRTREQYYEGKADWHALAEVKKALKIPVIGNGDVFSGADALRMMAETGVDAVMVARGALGNPWIFTEAVKLWDMCAGMAGSVSDKMIREAASKPDRNERINMLIRHIDMVIADKGELIAVKEMRKHIAWYTKGLRGSAAVRRRANTISEAAELKKLLTELK